MDIADAVERLFAPARRPGGVGVEIELITVTDTAESCPVDPAVLAAGFDAAFVEAARPTFEPGGQLELSPPPRYSRARLIHDVHTLIGRATAIAHERGVRLETKGVNPYHSCADVPLRTPKPRYLAMQEAFDEVGPEGRRMMRLTASLQIAVDLFPGEAGHEQWLVANLAGPALAAAFDNSQGERTRIWQRADLRRTGYDGRYLDPTDPIGAYLDFAKAAPQLPIPETEDACYHLTTLFPPVRPRGGYLELRYLDAQPLERIGEAITTVETLLYDAQARRAALDLLMPRVGDLQQAWNESAAGRSPQTADLLEIVRPSLVGAA
ncbi:glutamate-cysteine ligase family protein [Tenggerimyces flavus]|uniref:glutamate--cysteine ligase n=1 Tax=Tenggerimyces flavus TaxID=1708749 RepID=A0ABV7YI60_9ACTN|nr:glutamate-cysteine ligase family protein [Tenggerimyces flavus]MBM7784081.1 glutamate--cysteine ligase [Tenggerimyces flavus]